MSLDQLVLYSTFVEFRDLHEISDVWYSDI